MTDKFSNGLYEPKYEHESCGLLIKFPFAFLRAVGEDLGFDLGV